MLTIPQIEALRTTNPQLYESLKRLAGASLGPNQGWSLDSQITDGDNYARVASAALTSGQIDPTKSGVLMKGSVPPSWSGSFTYASTTSSLIWSWTGLSIYRADGTTTAIPDGSSAITGLAAGATYYFYPYWDEIASALGWVAGGAGSSGFAQSAKTNSAAQQQSLQGRVPLSQGAIVAATTTSGTGGGSGGGSGSCLRAGSMVLTKERGTVPIESCKVGEHLRCPSRRRRRIVDTHHPPRSSRRRNFHPPAFLQRRIARRHPAPHLHPRRRLPHARRAPLPKRRLRRPLRPPNPDPHRSHLPGNADLPIGAFLFVCHGGSAGLQPREKRASPRGASAPALIRRRPLAKGDRKLRALAPILRRPPLRLHPHPQLHLLVVAVCSSPLQG